MRILIFITSLVVLFSSSLSARLEWPNANPQHGLCAITTNDTCADGYICDTRTLETRGFGICRQGCMNDSDCEAGQVCTTYEDFPVCVDQE